MAGRDLSIALICALATLVACVLPAAPTPSSSAERNPHHAQINLGRHLFYDRQLSGPGDTACASCHQQRLAFSDGHPTASNGRGERLLRNTPSLLNVAQRRRLSWANPNRRTLEEQIGVALFTAQPAEMAVAGHEAAVLARLAADPAYTARFAAAFPNTTDPFNWANITAALAAFTRSLNGTNSRYDRFTQGDPTALSLSAQRGMALFFSAGTACAHCHTDLTAPQADGVYLANGAGRSPDRGLAELTGKPADAYHFRVPPLRNVAVTGPYMHDGSLATLDAVIRFYESGGQQGAGSEAARAQARHPLVAGFGLLDSERNDLINFLSALTDQDALTAAKLGNPKLTVEQVERQE